MFVLHSIETAKQFCLNLPKSTSEYSQVSDLYSQANVERISEDHPFFFLFVLFLPFYFFFMVAPGLSQRPIRLSLPCHIVTMLGLFFHIAFFMLCLLTRREYNRYYNHTTVYWRNQTVYGTGTPDLLYKSFLVHLAIESVFILCFRLFVFEKA